MNGTWYYAHPNKFIIGCGGEGFHYVGVLTYMAIKQFEYKWRKQIEKPWMAHVYSNLLRMKFQFRIHLSIYQPHTNTKTTKQETSVYTLKIHGWVKITGTNQSIILAI